MINAMLPFKENDNQKKRKQGLTHSAPRRKPSMMTLKARIQSRRREVNSGRKPLDEKIIAEQLAKIDEKEADKDSTRPSLLAEFLSENNAPSTSNQDSNSTVVSSLPPSTECPSSSTMIVNQQASNRSRSESYIAAPMTEAPAPSFNPAQTEATVGRNDGEDFEIEYDAPQAHTPYAYPTQTDGTSQNTIDDTIESIARGDNPGTEGQSAEQSSTRKIIPRRKPVRALAKEYWIGQNGKEVRDSQRNVPQTSQTQSVEEYLAEIARKKLPPTAETGNLGAGNMENQETQPESSSNARGALLLEMDEETGVEGDFRMNTPIGMYNDYSQDIFSGPDYSQLSALRIAPANEYNSPSRSSQASSASLPNVVPTDGMTHGTTLSIAPPPRMLDAIMKRVSNEMKQREESGSLDFGPIQVQLTATGKELDDSISFLNNLIGQLEAAKQNQ